MSTARFRSAFVTKLLSARPAVSACALFAAAVLALAPQGRATLAVSYQFTGAGNWSLNGVGSNNTPVGTISEIVPLGSTVEKAFLYSTMTPEGSASAPTIIMDGLTINPAAFTALGLSPAGLQAFRADVTSQVAAKIGSGSNSPFSFSIDSENPNFSTDGEALCIVYSNPAEAVRTIAFLDGFTASGGDSTAFQFASPVDPTVSGFQALMSLGIGYGYQDSSINDQYTIVNINGQRLTTSAGGQDDGQATSGGLITLGGIGDSIANPADPYALPGALGLRSDDELYNVASFIHTGDMSFAVSTRNPSENDNIFFLGLNVTAQGTTPHPSDQPVPEPITAAACLMGLGAVGTYLRKRLRSQRD